MNVLLLNPGSSRILRMFQDMSQMEIPLGLAYLASALEREGHAVKIIDLNVIATAAELRSTLGGAVFDVVGVTSVTPLISSCFRTVRVMRRLFPRAKTVVGGWHASTLPLKTLEDCMAVDFVVKGEGEETIVELVHAIEYKRDFSSIKGLAYRDLSGALHENEDRPLIKNVDTIPFPAWHLLPMDAYKKIGYYTLGVYYKRDISVACILTSRGCANRCAFCADHVIYKETCRLRSAENVIAEIEYMIKKFNIRLFSFYDADFFLSPIHVQRICELIIKKNLQFLWTSSGRVNRVSKELLLLMKRAGCIRVSFGVESGSPRILKSMHKNIRITQVKDAVASAKAVGMPVYVSFLYGMPGETIEDARMTRQLLWELKPDFVSQSAIVPYPGTDMYEYTRQRGIIKTVPWDHYSYMFNDLVDQPELKRVGAFQRRTYRDFYASPFFLLQSVRNLKSIYHLWFYVKGLYNFIRFTLQQS